MITTLKDLKKAFPGLITTSGRIYHIDGLGDFYQKERFGGLETYTRDFDDVWISTSFEDLVNWMIQAYDYEIKDGYNELENKRQELLAVGSDLRPKEYDQHEMLEKLLYSKEV